mmetsp:Transcript_26146/g.53019  ORF Transcript_26146/g.53019 Transcript_26146/m.53019 type:complete len:576 (+) Transcript_26146:162-1889(+)
MSSEARFEAMSDTPVENDEHDDHRQQQQRESDSTATSANRQPQNQANQPKQKKQRGRRGMYSSINIEIIDEHNATDDNGNGRRGGALSHNNANGSAASSSSKPNRELVKLVAVAATTAATLGYDVGSMAGAIIPIDAHFNLSSIQKELAMGSLNFVAAGGALIGGPVADRYGRKKTVGLTCWLFLVGTIFMAAATNYVLLLIGRMVAGLGVGVAFIAAPVFISEVSPPSMRGELNTTFDVAINVGILLGYIVSYLVQVIIPTEWNWRLMLGLGGLFPLVVLCLLSGLPESPRWLMLDDQKPAARAVLHRLGSTEMESEEAIEAMEKEIGVHRRVASSAGSKSTKKCCNCGKGQRLAVGLGFWQQISGTEAVLYYSADFLARAGLQSPELRLLGNVAVGCSKLIPELIAMRLVDGVGRRPLLMTSSFLLTVTTFLMGVAFVQGWSPVVVIVLLCLIMASFSVGVGPFTFLCASENLALSERAWGMTMCAAANRCTSGLVALTAVSISEWLTDAGLFFLYGSAGLAALVFYCRVVPETSGATLEELAAARAQAAGNDDDGRGNEGDLLGPQPIGTFA